MNKSIINERLFISTLINMSMIIFNFIFFVFYLMKIWYLYCCCYNNAYLSSQISVYIGECVYWLTKLKCKDSAYISSNDLFLSLLDSILDLGRTIKTSESIPWGVDIRSQKRDVLPVSSGGNVSVNLLHSIIYLCFIYRVTSCGSEIYV